MLAARPQDGRGFLLVTGHVGNWEMGAVTLRGHDLRPGRRRAAGARPERPGNAAAAAARLGVESIDIGSSMATAFRCGRAVERGRAVALLVDRAYPEDRVIVPFFGRPTPFLRSPALLARFCGCAILPGFFLRNPDGSYFNVWGEPLAADPTLSPDEDARADHDARRRGPRGVVRAHPTQWFNFYRFWEADGERRSEEGGGRPGPETRRARPLRRRRSSRSTGADRERLLRELLAELRPSPPSRSPGTTARRTLPMK